MPDMPAVHETGLPFLTELLTFLVTAIVVVPVSRMLRISPIIGFLGVGVLVGPSALGIARDAERIEALAELGVVFLMFTIGLDLSLERLWKARRYVFGMGALQLFGCATVIGGLAFMWGNSWGASVLLGLSMGLSSTAMVMQLLIERGQLSSRAGRTSFAILLFQDLAVVPILFLAGLLSARGGVSDFSGFALAMGKAALAVASILVLGRLLVRPLFRRVAALRSPELFMALTLLAILGTAVATFHAGLSMALGAFLAGMLLAESEFRHQIDANIQPFKGLLLGLFFISVGMRIDLSMIVDDWGRIGAAVVGLYAVKAAVITALALAWRHTLPQALQVGFNLGQGGEFAFVVIAAALAGAVIAPETAQFMLVVTGLSIAVTPFAGLLGEWITRKAAEGGSPDPAGAAPGELADLEDHVVIAGFGRVGRTVAGLLADRKVPYVALDSNPESVSALHRTGLPVFLGDARRPEVLEAVRASQASALVITLDDPRSVQETLAAAHQHWPRLRIFVRARDTEHARELMAGGACQAVPEMIESSLQLAAEVLLDRGIPADAVTPLVEQVRGQVYDDIRPKDSRPA
ncbi:monovalent cation:proton antiporter-2 (CPA2) family protein [Emcibacter sp. SYSU 3D8]|uniref:monovalent cation:proton antiporter-2 (CPA2) family protein n=1 Tax=Emcibacter sp. SYSU 3D8 TaxID=3133969 RepID=UPI0031FE98E0